MNSRAVDTEPEVKQGAGANGHEVEKESFAEVALKLGGKSAEEARRMARRQGRRPGRSLVRSAVSNRQQPRPPRGLGRSDPDQRIHQHAGPDPAARAKGDGRFAGRRAQALPGWLAAERDQEQHLKDGARRTRRRRLLGLARRSRIRRLGRSVLVVRSVLDQDGHGRWHHRRHGQRAWLYRCGRSGPLVR